MNQVSYLYAIANIAIQDGRKALSIFLPSVQLPSRCLKDLKISFADLFQHNHTLAFLNFCIMKEGRAGLPKRPAQPEN